VFETRTAPEQTCFSGQDVSRFFHKMGMRVTQYGEAVLRERGSVVTNFDEELATLADEMCDTMRSHDGIGLAAQQVGRTMQICVVDLGQAARETGGARWDGRDVPPTILMPLVLVNPKIEVSAPDEIDFMEEGCLSFYKVRGDVPRPERIEVTYQDLQGIQHHLACEGLLSRCIQHEVDHLNGVLFIDRMDKQDFAKIRGKARRLKRRNQLVDPS